MNLLFDMITTCRRTGAGEYVRRVFFSLLESVQLQRGVNIFCLYDSKRGFGYNDLTLDCLKKYGVETIDVNGQNLQTIISHYHIDRVFIGCAQFWQDYQGIEDLECEVVCVIHDLSHQEKFRNHITEYCKLRKHSMLSLSYSLWRLRRREGSNRKLDAFISLAKRNPKTQIVVVSDYTRSSLQYLTDIPMERVQVLYSPLRLPPDERPIENRQVAELINSGERFFVLLGAHISLKGGFKAIPAFARYIETGGRGKLLTIGRGIRKEYDCQVVAGFICDSDLDAVFRHCHALIYPSLFEGFGYPPLEAMRYGKPVICSNACSIPQVLGDAPIYFSPFYETAVYQALQTFDQSDYDTLAERSRRQYHAVYERQELDLQSLLNILTH